MSFDNDIFSSQGSKVDGGYETLEERIYNWNWEESPKFGDDQEAEKVQHSVRFRPWQNNAIDMLANRLGTDSGWIRFCAFTHGIKVLRENLHTDTWNHVGTVKEWVHWIMTDYSNVSSRSDKVMDMVGTEEESDPVRTGLVDFDSPKLSSDPYNVMMIPNDKRHIETEYVESGFVGGWIYREIISLGLSDSELLPSMYVSNCEEMREVIPEILENSYKGVGDNLSKFIQSESNHWQENGVHESVLTDMRIVASQIPDARMGIIDSILDRVEDVSDVLEHDPDVYTPMLVAREEDREKIKHGIGYYYDWMQ